MLLPEFLFNTFDGVSIRRFIAQTSNDRKYAEPEAISRALVVEQSVEVRDDRPSSATQGKMIAASIAIGMQATVAAVPPYSIVTVGGRDFTVVTSARNVHDRAPSSTQIWAV